MVNRLQFDLKRLDSMTKYPSILAYHPRHPGTGILQEGTPAAFPGDVHVTEKIDGCNGRIVLLPDGSWLIGSRTQFLTAAGDWVANDADGMVTALEPVARHLGDLTRGTGTIAAVYFEVYGGRSTSKAARQYTSNQELAVALFDVVHIEEWEKIMLWDVREISSWRDAGGQPFYEEAALDLFAQDAGLFRVPSLVRADPQDLPVTIEETLTWAKELTGRSRATLDTACPGQPEGVVLRTATRSHIRKIRIGEYMQVLRKRAKEA